MSKSLSNGTLSLRFMQNALRRQQLQEVELIRAEINDESKWEVGQDVRKAWGIGRGTQQSDAVAYESSYLPFLFSSEHEDTTSQVSRPLGRRVFNKKGLDVSLGESQSQPQQGTDKDGDAPSGEGGPSASYTHDTTDGMPVMKGRKYRVHANPMPISSASLNQRSLEGFEVGELPAQGDPGSTRARDAIFSLGDVGTDLRFAKGGVQGSLEDMKPIQTQSASVKTKEETSSISTGFLKPQGVDEPTARKRNLAFVNLKQSPGALVPDIIDGARKKKKRQRDAVDPGDEAREKKSKNKRPATRASTGDPQ